MHFRLLSQILLFGAVLADLECADFILPNWTTDRVRLNVIDATSKPPFKTTPANLTATNPIHLARTSRPGSRFHMQTCNSTSLNFQAGTTCGDNFDGSGYTRRLRDHVQIIDVYGNCLTSAADSNITWTACNENPSNTSQIWEADYVYTCTQDCCSDPSAVEQYPTSVSIYPPYTPDAPALFYDLTSDPAHRILALTTQYGKLRGHNAAVFALVADATK